MGGERRKENTWQDMLGQDLHTCSRLKLPCLRMIELCHSNPQDQRFRVQMRGVKPLGEAKRVTKLTIRARDAILRTVEQRNME